MYYVDVGYFFQFITIVLAGYFFIWGQTTSFIIVLLPSLFLFYLSSLGKKDWGYFVLKVITLFQALAIWASITSDMWSSIPDDHILKSPVVKNTMNKITNSAQDLNSVIMKRPITVLSTKAKDNTRKLITKAFGELKPSNFDDLKFRSAQEVREFFPKMFSEIPQDGFLPDFKNPCWYRNGEDGSRDIRNLACLPYVYLLGQPKCGTSDLFNRLIHHPQIAPPKRKEIRW